MTEEAHVINSGAASGEGGARRSPSELAKQLQKTMLAIKGSFISGDGKGVDYASIAGSELFQAYVSLASELRNCDPSSLEENERKAFFISILNAPHWLGLMCVCPEQCNGHPYSRIYAHTPPHTCTYILHPFEIRCNYDLKSANICSTFLLAGNSLTLVVKTFIMP